MANILRYPYDAITDKTDYFQIDIQNYKSVKENTRSLVSGTGRRRTSFSNVGNVKSLSTNTLVPGGTIFLPMPSNIQDGNSVTYSDDSLNGIVAAAVGGVQGLTGISFGNNFQNAVTEATSKVGQLFNTTLDAAGGFGGARELVLKALAAQAVNVFGGNVSIDQLLAREKGEIFNPNMELLFNGVTLRSFKFSFKMTPRSKKESEQVKFIIRSLKQNMAPKAGSSTTFLSTPNVFNLTYKQGLGEHKFLHKFKQCALTDMSVNYTGENVYATYGDGTPISLIMDLTFKELEPIYASDYEGSEGIPAPEGVGY